MELLGRLHPLIVHFPIALVIIAALLELVATATGNERWRSAAVINLQAGAAFGVVAAIAGWILAGAPSSEATPLLAWHRSLGVIAAGLDVCAAGATLRRRAASRPRWFYRTALFAAATCIAITGHLGGLLVWGADFLRP